ncbi:3-deoxy-D-manno-octulosonate 8-phosphate phosphatase (KDO 8-P phosphatase) [Ulvibacter sp. MAR_2010_11]|uniref:KdsC family phosphatase n=1 Tax=Ulvibacter sp. MAR_2010_11 TaxID=1250229 RepID=UPI000C2CBD32|nr:HAD-IIIA family hydrolase [Ulvibacter sp. MAR_2010_11]PKA84002.1 3-deoxy-D-manno-octulosonate 8-phosphate phosphatase (KDO 8-P phosphatase) [Ulvibacter sp. MAR_2010_11]
MEKSYKEYLQHITTFVFDVDGVLTDGTIQVTTSGELFRTMHTKDGFALKTALEQGFKVCIISGGTNEGVRNRLQGLGLTDIHLGAHHKTETLNRYLQSANVKRENVLFMGDDIPDLEVMQQVGLPCCPQDAVPEIKEISTYVSHKNGGKGCVRDVIEQVLKVQGKWLSNGATSAKYD